MPEVYTELTQPTAVNTAISLPFTSSSAQNVVVAKTSFLQIFALTHLDADLDPEFTRQENELEGSADFDKRVSAVGDQDQFMTSEVNISRPPSKVTKLVLVGEYNLPGTVVSLARIRVLSSKSGGDCLLVHTKDAKISLVEWDPSINGISTISIHYYEREEFKSPFMPDYCSSYLTADPQSRCAALKFNQDMLAILPFRQKDEYILDDIDEDMFDADSGEKATAGPKKAANGTGTGPQLEKPYHPSFVVSASQLDEAIKHIVSIAFLYEYREPTFGILYQPKRTAVGLLDSHRERKDNVHYIVITLDLEQRASTPIISVSELPHDCSRVVPLPTPIGGALLLGANQLIHVDQAGKTVGVAVNIYARQTTAFLLADQSDLEVELEGCQVEILDEDEGDLLIITKHGQGLLLRFKMDGRSVSSITLVKLGSDNIKGAFCGGRPSCLVSIGNRKLFSGSMEADARVLGWRRKGERIKIDEVKEEPVFDDNDDEYAFDDLDDLYGSGQQATVGASKASAFGGKSKGDYIFQIHDRLLNLGPFTDITFGRPTFPEEQSKKQTGSIAELEVVGATGGTHAEDGGISIIRNKLTPSVVGRFDFPQCEALWTIRTRKVPKKGTLETDDVALADEFDRYLITSKAEDSLIFRVGGVFQEVTGTEFINQGATIEAGVLREGRRIVQCCETVVRVYDRDLIITQLIPMLDEETDAEYTIVSASFCDPYLLLIRDDGSAIIYFCDEQTLELEPLPGSEEKKSKKYDTGCLYAAKPGSFLPSASKDAGKTYLCFLLSENGTFEIYNFVEDYSTPFFTTASLPYLPRFLASSEKNPPDRPNLKRKISEVLLVDVGDSTSKQPYLILRTHRDDIVIYQPYLFRKNNVSSLRFVKNTNQRIPLPAEGPQLNTKIRKRRCMTVLPDVHGYTAVFMPGNSPSFIIKSSKSPPRVHPLAGAPVKSVSGFHTGACDRGFIYADSHGTVRVCQLPDFSYDNVWSAKKIYLQKRVHGVAYYPPMNVYTVLTSSRGPFVPVPEGENPQPPTEPPAILMPTADTGTIHLYSPLTWSSIDTYALQPYETPLTVKVIELEVSEQTKQRRQLLAIGTGIFRGEDQAARGCIYVFEVVEVVPEPGRPETNRKLKLVVKEEVKGTVSAICGVDGFLLAAQGQKVMVRGLKEDDSLLPVGFMDMNNYVTVAKSLSSMLLFGDFTKGVSFVGFSEEPYKMTQFGKDNTLPVLTAEFLPDGDNLYFVVADADAVLHILQYDPEHPRSLVGQRLIHKAAFFSGHETRCLALLPRTRVPPPVGVGQSDNDAMDTTPDNSHQQYQILGASTTGALSLLTTIPETTYRRLSIISSNIISTEDHPAGLNPRAYRSPESYNGPYRGGWVNDVSRAVLDGAVLGRWIGLSEVRRVEVAGKARVGEEMVRADLGSIEGGVGYF